MYEIEKPKPNSLSQRNITELSNEKPIKMMIPKEHILMNLKAHQSIKSSLENLIR
jgi:hypothetical protein